MIERLLDLNLGEQVDPSKYSYTPLPDGSTYYKFLGWSETKNPSADAEQKGKFNAFDNVSLYPILKSGHYVYFNTNSTGSGVKYIESAFLSNQDFLSTAEVPERAGYAFNGWYYWNGEAWEQVFSATGAPAGADGSTGYGRFKNGLSENLILYAGWTPQQTKMTVVWWVQNATDEAGLADEDKTYDFVKKVEYTKGKNEDGNEVPLLSGSLGAAKEEMFTKPEYHITGEDPKGFVYNASRSDTDYVPLEGDGSTTFNIYFDRKTFVLSFRDHVYVGTGTDNAQSTIASKTELARIVALYGSNLTKYWPLNPNEGVDEGTIGSSWSWSAPNQTPSSIASAFKAIPQMPLINDGTLNTTVTFKDGDEDEGREVAAGIVYFGHNMVTDGQANKYSHSYVTVDPDADLEQVKQDYENHVKVTENWPTAWPQVDKYIYDAASNTYYEHRLTQPHAFNYNNDINNSTAITYAGYFFDMEGFTQKSSNPKYYTYTYDSSTSGRGNNLKYTYTYSYTESTAADAKPYDISKKTYTTTNNTDAPEKGPKYTSGIDNMIHLYTRDVNTLRVMVKWGNENAKDVYSNDKVPYEKNISKDDLDGYLNTYLNNRPIPDGWEFTGWFKDEDLTNEITDFSKLEMPADNLTIYAGIQPKWYVVTIDPNGGEIDQDKNQSTWMWRQHGDKSLSEYDISRDYIKKDGGEYSYVQYKRGYADEKVRKAEYVLTSEAPKAAEGLEVTPGYAKEDNAYVLVGWYRLKSINADGTKVLEDQPYAFGSEIHDSFTLVAKWRRNASYFLQYSADAVDEEGHTYTVMPPTDSTEYAELAGAIIKGLDSAPEGKRLKYWKVMVGDEKKATVLANESLEISDEISTNYSTEGGKNIKHITLVPVLEDDPGTGQAEGSSTDIRSYWFFIGPENEKDDQKVMEYYQGLRDKSEYSSSTAEGKAALSDKAYYVQNISPGEELVVPTPPDDPSGLARPFQGWYADPYLTKRFAGFGTVSSPMNTKLYASFDPGYEVIYKDKDGHQIGKQYYSKSGKAKLVTYGVTFTPTDGTMMYGWTDEKNGTEPKYDYNSTTEQSLTVNEEKVLYPVTGVKQYLYFDSNGGSYVEPVVLPINRQPDAPENDPGRAGYNFTGWFTENDGGEQYKFGKGAKLPEGVTKLYAHWQIQSSSSVDSSYKVLFWVKQENGSYKYSNEITVSNGVFVADKISAAPYGNLTGNPSYATAITDGRAYYRLDHAVDDKGNKIYAADENGKVTTDERMVVEDHGSELNGFCNRKEIFGFYRYHRSD